MTTVPTLQAVAPGIVTLADHEKHAQTRLDTNAWAYFSGGAGDELTVAANRDAWNRISLLPRVMRSLEGGNTRLSLLGRTLAHPILIAPIASQTMAHPDGEAAVALAAASQGAGLILSTLSGISMEQIASLVASDAGRGPLWFQLYLQHDRELTRQLIQRAEKSGYEALVLTVDAASSGARDRERRIGFRRPPGVVAANLAGMPLPRAPAAGAGFFELAQAAAPTWADVEWLRAVSTLPLIVKGILHPEDARIAVQSGASGIVVSNHGGRTLDTVVATAQALPGVVEAVDGAVAVLVDGGIRRGTDVLKALALGADAVLVGRPCIYGLANAGALGVAHVLKLLRDELEIAMGLCGVARLEDIQPGLLCQPV